MSKKKSLMNLFTQDVVYNYHLVKTEEPNGHLIYIIKNGSKLDKEMFEFYPTLIAEELIKYCNVKFEKFAPSIFFTEEESIEKLKYELNEKFSEDAEFSAFIEEIKDEYRALEVRDSLLYKKDPEAYNAVKEAEHIEHQKELWGDMVEQMQQKKKKREDFILAYNNDLIKLLKEYFDSIVEYEKRDFNLIVELEQIIGNLIDPETWIKIEEKPFICRIEPISLETDKMNVFLTDNNDYSYTADLRLDKTALITENIVRITKDDFLPNPMHDYEFLAQLYDVDITNVPEWNFKNDTDRFEYVIDYLAPIFKAEKEKRKQEVIDKVLAKKGKTDVSELEYEDFDDEDDNEDNNKHNDWYFDVSMSPDVGDLSIPSCVALSKDGAGLDDQLGSHNLPKNIIDALNRAGIFGDSELMEGIWEVNDHESKTKEEIIESMEKEGFQYSPGLF